MRSCWMSSPWWEMLFYDCSSRVLCSAFRQNVSTNLSFWHNPDILAVILFPSVFRSIIAILFIVLYGLQMGATLDSTFVFDLFGTFMACKMKHFVVHYDVVSYRGLAWKYVHILMFDIYNLKYFKVNCGRSKAPTFLTSRTRSVIGGSFYGCGLVWTLFWFLFKYERSDGTGHMMV